MVSRLDDLRWADLSPAERPRAGWYIVRSRLDEDTRGSKPHRLRLEFLQIATGQWCSAIYATWFPTATAAQIYADELEIREPLDGRWSAPRLVLLPEPDLA